MSNGSSDNQSNQRTCNQPQNQQVAGIPDDDEIPRDPHIMEHMHDYLVEFEGRRRTPQPMIHMAPQFAVQRRIQPILERGRIRREHRVEGEPSPPPAQEPEPPSPEPELVLPGRPQRFRDSVPNYSDADDSAEDRYDVDFVPEAEPNRRQRARRGRPRGSGAPRAQRPPRIPVPTNEPRPRTAPSNSLTSCMTSSPSPSTSVSSTTSFISTPSERLATFRNYVESDGESDDEKDEDFCPGSSGAKKKSKKLAKKCRR